MPKHSSYCPPFSVTPKSINLVTQISEIIGGITHQKISDKSLKLRRINQIRSIQGSLAIEGNSLTEEQITAILDGKKVLAPAREILEVQNAIAAYDRLPHWKPDNEKNLLEAHRLLMKNLIEKPGFYRRGGVGVMAKDKVVHMAPPASRVPLLMADLFSWLKTSKDHPLITSSVFHYEFEFIHPFSDGNGRMGRLWQSLILTRWTPLFADIPVESLVHQHQKKYYKALQDSTVKTDSFPFIEFMLQMILEALGYAAPQVTPQVTPQVERLLKTLKNQMSRDEIQSDLKLTDRKSFRERYLLPALDAKLVEMLIPEKPNSRFQKYQLSDHGQSWIKNNISKK